MIQELLLPPLREERNKTHFPQRRTIEREDHSMEVSKSMGGAYEGMDPGRLASESVSPKNMFFQGNDAVIACGL